VGVGGQAGEERLHRVRAAIVDERQDRAAVRAELGLPPRSVLEGVGEPGPRDRFELDTITRVADESGEELEKLPAVVRLGAGARRDVLDHRPQIGVATEAAGEPHVGTLRCREERRARAEAEAGDRDGARDTSRVVQGGDDGGNLVAVQLERRERVELRHEGQRTVAREESRESSQVGLAAAGGREPVNEDDRAARMP